MLQPLFGSYALFKSLTVNNSYHSLFSPRWPLIVWAELIDCVRASGSVVRYPWKLIPSYDVFHLMRMHGMRVYLGK